MNSKDLCFVIGSQNTGTSTMTGMLNCHPDFLILFEVFMARSLPSKYGRQFLEVYPGARHLFGHHDDISVRYEGLRQWLAEQGHSYKCVGDKLAGMEFDDLRRVQDFKNIVMVRDIRTWLAKNSVSFSYMTEHDVVPVAIDYTKHMLKSLTLEHRLPVRLEDLIRNNQQIIDRLSHFLGQEMRPHLDQWWQKCRTLSDNGPKTALKWLSVHPSSKIQPTAEDTKVTLKPHPFWDNLLPLFDKYFDNLDGHYDSSDLETDIAALESLRNLSPVSLHECYEEISSISLTRMNENGQLFGQRVAKLENGKFTNEYGTQLRPVTVPAS